MCEMCEKSQSSLIRLRHIKPVNQLRLFFSLSSGWLEKKVKKANQNLLSKLLLKPKEKKPILNPTIYFKSITFIEKPGNHQDFGRKTDQLSRKLTWVSILPTHWRKMPLLLSKWLSC